MGVSAMENSLPATSDTSKVKTKRSCRWLLLTLIMLIGLCLLVSCLIAAVVIWQRQDNDPQPDPEPITNQEPQTPETKPASVVYYYVNCGFYQYSQGKVSEMTSQLTGFTKPSTCYEEPTAIKAERYLFSQRYYKANGDLDKVVNYDIDLKAKTVRQLKVTTEGLLSFSNSNQTYFLYNPSVGKLYKFAADAATPSEIFMVDGEIAGRGGAPADITSIELNQAETRILINDTISRFDSTGKALQPGEDIMVLDLSGKLLTKVQGSNAAWISNDEFIYYDGGPNASNSGAKKASDTLRKYDLKTATSSSIISTKVLPADFLTDTDFYYLTDMRAVADTYRLFKIDLGSLQSEVLYDGMYDGRLVDGKLVGFNVVKCNLENFEESEKTYDELLAEGKLPCSLAGSGGLYTDGLVEIDLSKPDKPKTNLLSFTPQLVS